MKKTIVNKYDAICDDCCGQGQVDLSANGYIFCTRCGGRNFHDRHGHPFEPIFVPARTFRASCYTPELPDRRVNSRPWPLIRERRAQGATT